MRISEMSARDVKSAVDEVEIALRKAPRLTKAVVISTLSGLGLCSPKSTGTEKTLLNALQKHGISIPEKFAELMGVPAGKSSPAPQANEPTAETLEDNAPTSQPPTVPARVRTVTRPAGVIPNFAMLGGVSAVAVRGQNGTAFMTDGEQRPVGGFDESDLRLKFNLIEFSVS